MIQQFRLSDGAAVLLSSVVWFLTSLIVGWRSVHWSRSRLERTGPLTTLRDWEDEGRIWQRLLRVRSWKARLPQAGGLFAGGAPMDQLSSRSTSGLEDFRSATVRAERVHWLILASTPLHYIWCRPTLALGMTMFGVAFNTPCLIVQRYNRAALERVILRRQRRE